MKSLFEYLEYRDYLKDHYEFHKSRRAFFSYRYISGKTGLDASFYVKVLQKQLHISNKAIEPLCRFLKLSKREVDYFRALVGFNRAKQRDKTKEHFERLIELREPRIRTLDAARYEFFTRWHYIAIRELLSCYAFSGDYKDLAARLNPPIRVTEARRAIALLGKLSLIKRNDDGVYTPTDQFITTGESWNSIAIENFQKETIELAASSIRRIPKKHRETSTVTVSMSKASFDAMKDRLREVRKELLEMARLDDRPEGVFQINFQVFPLTRLDREAK